MAELIKLWDELDLIKKLRKDTLLIVQNCQSIPPIKKLVECHDILDLTETIVKSFPTTPPEPPVCDEAALMHLRRLISEINLFYPKEIPQPHFLNFEMKILTLLRIFGLPKDGSEENFYGKFL